MRVPRPSCKTRRSRTACPSHFHKVSFAGRTADSLGLTGRERYDILGVPDLLRRGLERGAEALVRVRNGAGAAREFRALVRIDTPQEARYYEHGGILPYVLRKLLGATEH